MENSHCPYDTGVIHGRFQVLHNDHLTYLLAGKALCRHLVVGITNPEPELIREENADPLRSHPLANPLTYYERYLLLKEVLSDQGLQASEVSIVPFPISFPKRYRYYVPMDAIFFLSIYDQWGERKQHYFESLGLQIHILRRVGPEEKGISATEIRRAMVEDKPWRYRVPSSCARLLMEWGIPSRLKHLLEGNRTS